MLYKYRRIFARHSKKKKHKKDNKNIFMYITKKRQSIFFRWPVMKVSKPRTSYKVDVVAPLQANSLFYTYIRVLCTHTKLSVGIKTKSTTQRSIFTQIYLGTCLDNIQRTRRRRFKT